jgi:SSS family solute:Na+ symporter
MIKNLSWVDGIVVIALLLFLVLSSFYSSFRKKSAEEYFMAGRSLKWYSVAGSIFGTNIHAQQIIGMMSVGYTVGFAQSHYEVWAIPAILILAYVFVPIYRKRQFFTLSQFLESRYNGSTRLAYTVLMIAFIMIQLVGGFYIGSRTLGLLVNEVGAQPVLTYLNGILLIALVTVVFTVFGGMESVVIADNILTVIMIIAVIMMGTLVYMQPEIGGLKGLLALDAAKEHKMHLYLPTNHEKLPWLGIFSGLTILNMFYWTTNQYQVQRVMVAQTERDAKLGAIAAGFLKLVIPFFSIAAGVAAYYLFKARFGEGVVKADDTFITLLKTVVPRGYGVIGLILAGLMCAIFSAIYSMMNSVSTMMAYDVFKKYIKPHAPDNEVVRFGQGFVVVMCAAAVGLALQTFDPNSNDNFFLKIAAQTSYIKPGLVVVFFWGIFWRKTHAMAAVTVLLTSPLIGLGCDAVYEWLVLHYPPVSAMFGAKFNFLYRVFCIFAISSVLLVVLSVWFNKVLTKSDATQDALTNDLTISTVGVRRVLGHAALVHVPLFLLAWEQTLSLTLCACIAAAVTFLLGIYYKNQYDKETPMLQSDIFYAGLLAAAMVFIMYFFA